MRVTSPTVRTVACYRVVQNVLSSSNSTALVAGMSASTIFAVIVTTNSLKGGSWNPSKEVIETLKFWALILYFLNQ